MRWTSKRERRLWVDGEAVGGFHQPGSSSACRHRRDDNVSCPAIWEETFSARPSSFVLPVPSPSFSGPDWLVSSFRPPLPWLPREHTASRSLDLHGKWPFLPCVPPDSVTAGNADASADSMSCGAADECPSAALIDSPLFLAPNHKGIYTFCFHNCKYCGECREGRKKKPGIFCSTENVT